MTARPGRGSALRAGLALGLIALAVHDGAAAAPARPAPPDRRRTDRSGERAKGLGALPRRVTPWRRVLPTEPVDRRPDNRPDSQPQKAPRGYLIHLTDGGDPIVVTRYFEDNNDIVFEKYGGWVRVPTYEVLKIVPDVPNPGDRTVNLPSPSTSADTWGAPLRPEPNLYVTMRGGGNIQVAGFTPDGDQVRVSAHDGSFTVPRSEIVSVVRVPSGDEVPEAWLSIVATEAESEPAATPVGLVPPAPDPRLPYQTSDRPHFVRLANGQLVRVEGFWVEDGEFRFRRFGGIVGIALGEVMRLFPEEIAPVRGRTPVRFVRRAGPDLIEVSVRSGYHRVRLVGIEPLSGTWTAEDPWRDMEPGAIIYLEFDRQRYDAEGYWLAYVFLANGRMLNAEMIRVGLARPALAQRNLRYLDLFHEMAGDDPPAVAASSSDP